MNTTNTTLPTLMEFKQIAKTFKKNNPTINTLGEALNVLAKQYGFKSWNVIKTKLVDIPLLSKGVLLIDTNKTPNRSLEFYFNNSSEDNPFMEYYVIEDSTILYTTRSINDAHIVFLTLDTSLDTESQLIPYELIITDRYIMINNTTINKTVFDNEILPYKCISTEHELRSLRNKVKNGLVPRFNFERFVYPKIEKLKVLSDDYIFNHIMEDSFCSAQTDTATFNFLCKRVLIETARLKKLKQN